MSKNKFQIVPEDIGYPNLIISTEVPSYHEYHFRLLEAYQKRCQRKNLASGSIMGILSALNEILTTINKPLWEIRTWDIDDFADAMINSGLSPSTRRAKIGHFKRFVEWVIKKYSKEIYLIYSSRLIQPVNEDNHIVHVHDDLTDKDPPPPRELLDHFFSFLSEYMNRAPHPEIVARDYTIYLSQYRVGMRIDEATMLDLKDIRFDLSDFGKIHIRFGKGTKTSGKRPRWVPMLTGADRLFKWYLTDVRNHFKTSKLSSAVFPSFHGARLIGKSAAVNLTKYLCLAGIPEDLHWSTHKFRHACATYNYEDGMDLVSIQHLLGHEDLKTTTIYVTPTENYIEKSYMKANSIIVGKYKDSGRGVYK